MDLFLYKEGIEKIREKKVEASEENGNRNTSDNHNECVSVGFLSGGPSDFFQFIFYSFQIAEYFVHSVVLKTALGGLYELYLYYSVF